MLPAQQASSLLAGLYQLDQSQWLTPQAIRELQFRQLQGVLEHANETVLYYKGRLAQSGFSADQSLTTQIWRNIPILKRVDVQQAGKELLSVRVPAQHGSVHQTQTSGSTGEPVKVCGTGITRYFWQLFTLRERLWHKRRFSGTLAAIRFLGGKALPPHGTRSACWSQATDHVFATGPSIGMEIGTDVSVQAEWLARNNPDYLITYPSNLLALTTYCRQHAIQLPGLKQVRTVGEIVTPSMRQACREVWNVPLVDMYTSQEFGYIALQCPEQEHYHVQAENVLVEVLDDEDKPCKPGETGRLVVTSLHNFAMPLIRYEIGDHAEVGEPCPCGRGLPVLNRILGRSRNMLVLPNGEQRWPLVGFREFRDIAPIRQYQFIQDSTSHLTGRFVVEQSLSGGAGTTAGKTYSKIAWPSLRYRLRISRQHPAWANG